MKKLVALLALAPTVALGASTRSMGFGYYINPSTRIEYMMQEKQKECTLHVHDTVYNEWEYFVDKKCDGVVDYYESYEGLKIKRSSLYKTRFERADKKYNAIVEQEKLAERAKKLLAGE